MTGKSRIAFLTLSLLLTASSGSAVVGGDPISPDHPAKPSIVNIKMKNGMCTGTVIAPTVVLTAAHCQDLFGRVELVARIDTGATAGCDVSRVVETSLAPGAARELPFRVHAPDVLLVRLATPLCGAKSAGLARAALSTGDVLTGAGHGRGSKRFGTAETFDFRMIETREAEEAVVPMTDLANEILTVGLRTYRFGLPVREGSSFCLGDSGGPAFKVVDGRMEVAGVNSAILPNERIGAKACDFSYLQIVTPVAPVLDWIDSQLNEWSSK